MTRRSFAAAFVRGCTYVAVSLSLVTLPGCAKSEDDAVAYLPLAPAMEIDPVNMPELPRWFTNNDITIEFDPSGFYRLYEGINRHAKPIERGRWVRANYASVRLEPYAVGRDARPVRGVLEKEGETLILDLPGSGKLRGLAGPPMSVEDELFGRWASDAGEAIELRTNMTYMHKPADGSQPALSGRWRVEGNGRTLILQSPNARGEAREFAIKRRENVLTLEVSGRVLLKE